eukprot:259875-Prymnesium_polylepis.1
MEKPNFFVKYFMRFTATSASVEDRPLVLSGVRWRNVGLIAAERGNGAAGGFQGVEEHLRTARRRRGQRPRHSRGPWRG